MSKSTTVITHIKRNKPGPKPTGKGHLIGVRLQDDLLHSLDANIGTGETRPEAIRRILREWLATNGYLK